MQDEIQIKIVSEVSRNDVILLYTEAGWWREKYEADTSFIDKIAANSFCFVGAFLVGRMVGMGRAISDGSSDAYIQDVTVLKEFRGKGIGKKIILTLLEFLQSEGVDWIGIVGEPGTEEFYKPLGFKRMESHVPMIYSANSSSQESDGN